MDVLSAILVEEDSKRGVALGFLLQQMPHVHLVVRLIPSAYLATRVLEYERADLLIVHHGKDDGIYLELINAAHKKGVPSLVLADEISDELDDRMLRAGVSQVLERGGLTAKMLDRSIRYALAQSLQRREWMRLALYDSTVNVASRRLFDMRLEEEFLRARRCQCELSLILADIDEFKRFNDTFGHLAGDECLRRVGETLRRCVQRISDLVCRYGGEEFAVILPATSPEGAAQIAERMRSEVARLSAHDGRRETTHVTISGGIATVVPDRSMRLDTLIERADRALYRAKRSGKNCMLAANGETQ